MTKDSERAVERAETIGRARARLFPLAGTALIILTALVSGDEPADLVARLAWVLLFAGGFVLVVTGGVAPRGLRALTDDESSRAHRFTSVFTGYCAAVACAAGLYIVTAFEPLSARQALQILLSTAIAAPLIGFGALERRALG